MPVSLLLCEGEANSADTRVLMKLLAGRCGVLPNGGKYGMGDRIKARREAIGQTTVFGLLDGDFVKDFQSPQGEPTKWIGSDRVQLGWRWERKEIEDYLIDPVVVQRALGDLSPPLANYLPALESARDSIVNYQASRIALTVCRPRFSPLPNCFGTKRGRMRHPFPENVDEPSCVTGMRETVKSHQIGLLVSEAVVESEYRGRLLECLSNGIRYQRYLHAFSGKDLLEAMTPALAGLGFMSAAVFLERILIGIDQTTENVGAWHPEWRALQEAIVTA